MSRAKLVLINLGVLLGIVLGLLALTSLISDVGRAVKNAIPKAADERTRLPNYPDRARAEQIFADLDRVKQAYAPFVEWRPQPLATPTMNIGEDGLRRHSIGRDNAPGARTIGFFGGSAMFGFGVDDDGTLPAQFDALGDGWEVANYGQVGWTSRQSLAMLINLANQNRGPDAAVFYEGYNDVWVHCNLAVGTDPNNHHEEPRMRDSLSRRKPSALYGNLIAPTVEYFRRLVTSEKAPDDFACDRDPALAERVAETLVRDWEIAAGIVRGYGGRFFALLQPNIFVGSPRLDHLKGLPQVEKMVRARFERQFSPVYPLIRDKLALRGLGWFHDVTDIFDRDEFIYIDTAHVTPNGNRILAERIRQIIMAAPEAQL